MKSFKNILYVSEAAADQASAVERTVSLAENSQATLTMIDVIAAVPEDDLVWAKTECMQALESLIEPFRRRLQIQIDVLVGAAVFLEVIRSVLRNSHDLVVKVAENPDFMKRLYGSDDMHLLRKCPCPVWLMKPPEKSRYDRILAAVDFDPLRSTSQEQLLNREILEAGAALALSDSAALHLVHAWEAFAERTILARGDSSKGDIAAHVENQYLLQQKGLYGLGEALRGWIGAGAYERLAPRFHLLKGSPKKNIAALATELQTDLVVMGTVARTGIAGFFIGNTAEAIPDQLTCSVLAVKPPGFTTPVKL